MDKDKAKKILLYVCIAIGLFATVYMIYDLLAPNEQVIYDPMSDPRVQKLVQENIKKDSLLDNEKQEKQRLVTALLQFSENQMVFAQTIKNKVAIIQQNKISDRNKIFSIKDNHELENTINTYYNQRYGNK